MSGLWPDFDQVLQRQLDDIDPNAIVYSVDAGPPGCERVILSAGVVEGQKVKRGTKRTIIMTKSDLADAV